MLFNGDGLRLQARLITSPLNKEYIGGKFPWENAVGWRECFVAKSEQDEPLYAIRTWQRRDENDDRTQLARKKI